MHKTIFRVIALPLTSTLPPPPPPRPKQQQQQQNSSNNNKDCALTWYDPHSLLIFNNVASLFLALSDDYILEVSQSVKKLNIVEHLEQTLSDVQKFVMFVIYDMETMHFLPLRKPLCWCFFDFFFF